MTRIKVQKFQDVFRRLDLIASSTRSGNYEIWNDPNNEGITTILPLNVDGIDYDFYQEKNIKFINYLLEKEDNEENRDEILSQLNEYNYKLINRIQTKVNYPQEMVPYKLADILINKNVHSFLNYFNRKTKAKQPLGIKNIQLNHTQHGSFVIPVSIGVSDQDVLPTVAPTLNIVLREYLETVMFISQLDYSNKELFSSSVLDRNLNSTFIKNFIDNASSIAFLNKEFDDVISHISISGRSNPILDFKLSPKEKHFQEVDLRKLQTADSDLLIFLEKKEIELNTEAINEIDAHLEVIVDGLDNNGKVKFSVVSINSEHIDKPFKAIVDEQPKSALNEFADAFISGEVVEINGDIRKQKSKVGKILIRNYKKKTPELSLLDNHE